MISLSTLILNKSSQSFFFVLIAFKLIDLNAKKHEAVVWFSMKKGRLQMASVCLGGYFRCTSFACLFWRFRSAYLKFRCFGSRKQNDFFS